MDIVHVFVAVSLLFSLYQNHQLKKQIEELKNAK